MNLNKSIFSILLLGSLTLSFSDMSIDAQIQEIKNAPAHERVQLMNQLKTKLADMNAEQRSEAISKLRTQTSVQNRVQSNQVDSMQQMHGIDRMNQKQVADKMHQNDTSNGLKQMKH